MGGLNGATSWLPKRQFGANEAFHQVRSNIHQSDPQTMHPLSPQVIKAFFSIEEATIEYILVTTRVVVSFR